MKNHLLATAAAAAVALACVFAAPANATPVQYDFSGNVNGNAYTAQVLLDVLGGHAIDGTGTITGAGLTGTQSLTLVTLSSPGVENDGGGLLGYRSNDGTDWFDADTVVPIDSCCGLIFAMGPNPVGYGTSQQFDVYGDGSGGFDAAFFGTSSPGVAPAYYAYNLPVNVTESNVPEPLTLSLFGVGMIGLIGLRNRKKMAPAALA